MNWNFTKRGFRCSVISIFLFTIITPLYSQIGVDKLSLKEAINIAHTHSTQSQLARFSFMGQYWDFRSFKAELRPSLNASSGLGNYNRSLVEVRDPETGQISYVSNNSLSNDLTLSIDQNIPLTGGRLSINSNISRLDQFSYDKVIYNSNPLTLNYSQPLRSYNALKWRKKTAPLQYENSKKRYLENIQNITIQTTNLFFSVLSAQINYKKSLTTYADRKHLFEIAKRRSELAKTTRGDILQLELSLLNADMYVNTSKLSFDIQLFNFCSYIGLKNIVTIDLIQPRNVQDMKLDFDEVIDKAYANSTHNDNQNLKLLESQRALAQVKSAKGIQADFRVNLGLSQTSSTFGGAYQTLKDREVVGVTLRMPIYDWGMSKGRVKMAETDLDITKMEIEEVDIEFRQNIKTKVIQFNNQARQCEISIIAQDIAQEIYEMTKKRFQNGTVTVTDLNNAQEDLDDAQNQFMRQLHTYWSAYYEIQKISLYDFINKVDIAVEFDELIE